MKTIHLFAIKTVIRAKITLYESLHGENSHEVNFALMTVFNFVKVTINKSRIKVSSVIF